MLLVNFQVLFKAWGLNLTAAEEAENFISIYRALQMAAKFMMLNSIIESKLIIGKNEIKDFKGSS